jgi:hypothetical protein
MARTFAELQAALQARGNAAKAASVKQAASDPTPEKDPSSVGNVAVPVDPAADPAKQNVPQSKTNADDVTKVLPPNTPAKTIEGEEKVSTNLNEKAAKVTAGIRNFVSALRKQAETMPPDNKANEGTGDGKVKPPTSNGEKGDPVTKTAAPDPTPEKDKTAQPAAAPAGDSKGAMPSDGKNVNETCKDGEKCAGCGKMSKECACTKSAFDVSSVDPSTLQKLASIIISTEEGRQFAHAMIEKQEGMEAADQLIKAAAQMEELDIQLQEAADAGAFQAEQMWEAMSPEDRAKTVKLAKVVAYHRDQLKTDGEKQAFDAGVSDAAAMSEGGMLGQEAPPEEAGTDEAIMMALDQLVQSGQLTPEDAAQILEALQSGGGGAGGAGGEAPPAEGGEEMPPEPEDEDVKESCVAVKQASAALDKLFPTK